MQLLRAALVLALWIVPSLAFAGHIYEIASTFILQPGPAALTEGVRRVQECLEAAVNSPAPTPQSL